MSSKSIKDALVADLVSFSNDLTEGVVDGFLIEPEELDNRDDVTDRHVCLYLGRRRPNITTGSSESLDTIQEVVIQVYIQSKRQKGSEEYYENLFDGICDDVFSWIQDIADNNRIYNLTSGNMRVPVKNETNFFVEQEEVFRNGKSTYTRIHIEPIRN